MSNPSWATRGTPSTLGTLAPLGWLTHTTARIHEYLRTQQPTPIPPTAPTAIDEQLTRLLRQVWHTLRDATVNNRLTPGAAEAILHSLDLPGLPRRWQVGLTLPLTMDVLAVDRDGAFEAAEDAIHAALDGGENDTRLEWERVIRDGATAGDVDATADAPELPT